MATAVETFSAELKSFGKEYGTRLKALEAENTSLKAEMKKWAETPNTKSVPAQPLDKKELGKLGYKHLGEYVRDVKAAATSPAMQDQLTKSLKDKIDKAGAALGLNESVESEGAYLVPPEFSNKIYERVYDNDLLERCDKYTVTGNSMVFPAIDEKSRVDGSRFGGVLAYWEDEAEAATPTKPKLRRLELKLNKLMALGYMTQELLDDAGPVGDQFLTKMFSEEIRFQVGAALIRGNGAGKPQGVLQTPSLITVTKESNQAAGTIVFGNIIKMYARMYAPSLATSAWFINQDVGPALDALAFPAGTSAVPIFLPPTGLKDAPYGSLRGRPIVPIEFCSSLGTVGDIIFADMSQMAIISKGSIDSQMSMHFKFDTDQMTYRVIFRIDGRGWWHAPLTPYQGTATQSPFIVLGTRS